MVGHCHRRCPKQPQLKQGLILVGSLQTSVFRGCSRDSLDGVLHSWLRLASAPWGFGIKQGGPLSRWMSLRPGARREAVGGLGGFSTVGREAHIGATSPGTAGVSAAKKSSRRPTPTFRVVGRCCRTHSLPWGGRCVQTVQPPPAQQVQWLCAVLVGAIASRCP